MGFWGNGSHTSSEPIILEISDCPFKSKLARFKALFSYKEASKYPDRLIKFMQRFLNSWVSRLNILLYKPLVPSSIIIDLSIVEELECFIGRILIYLGRNI